MATTVTTGAIHGRTTRVLVEGLDLSCQLRDASISLNGDVVESTSFCRSLKSYVSGLPDGRMSLSGFLDAGTTEGNFALFMPKFTAGTRINFVIQPEGNTVMGLAMAASGLITSMQISQQVADLEAISMEVQLTGELYSMRTLLPITTQITEAGANNHIGFNNRTTQMVAPYDTTSYASGMIYYMVRNNQTASRDVNIWNSESALVNGTAPTPSGVAPFVVQELATTLAAGAVATGAIGTYNAPRNVYQYVGLEFEDAAAAEVNYGYLGLVDLEQSLLDK